MQIELSSQPAQDWSKDTVIAVYNADEQLLLHIFKDVKSVMKMFLVPHYSVQHSYSRKQRFTSDLFPGKKFAARTKKREPYMTFNSSGIMNELKPAA